MTDLYFYDKEAEEVLNNYVSIWKERPGIIRRKICGISNWKDKMIKADLAMSRFIGGMRIKEETKEKLNDKFQEIYPQMLKFLNYN